MAIIKRKLSSLRDSKYECDRIGYQNYIERYGDTDDYRIIDTEELIFLDFDDFFNQQEHFIIDTDTSLLMALSISIRDKDNIYYDKEHKNFYLRYSVRKRRSIDSDWLNISGGSIEIPEDEFCSALLFCAYIDKRLDITRHPAMANRLQEVINNYIAQLEKQNKCSSYDVLRSLAFLKEQEYKMKILFVDKSIKNEPEILFSSQNFEVSRVESKIRIKTNKQNLETLKTANNISIYIINEDDSLCFELLWNHNIDFSNFNNSITVSFDHKEKLLDQNNTEYFNNKIKPKIQIYNMFSTAERVKATFMNDLFDW